MRRIIERAQAGVDVKVDKRRRLGILKAFRGSDQQLSLWALFIDPANKNGTPLRGKTQHVSLLWTCSQIPLLEQAPMPIAGINVVNLVHNMVMRLS